MKKNYILRTILIILAIIPLFYWQPFYEHFYTYLTGTIISNVIKDQWRTVLISIWFFVLLLIPLNYRRRTKWVDYSIWIAFFVSLFIEMYGIPLTILFASKYFFIPWIKLPDNVVEFSFFWVKMGMDHAMFYGTIVMIIWIIFIVVGWYSLYIQIKSNTFARTWIYSISRHPQYLGFTLLLLGWFVGWPTIITVVFSPILIYKYLRAAKLEEKDSEEIFGEEYREYCKKTPFLI